MRKTLLVLVVVVGPLLPATSEAADRLVLRWTGLVLVSAGAVVHADALAGSEDFAHPTQEPPRLRKGIVGGALVAAGVGFIWKSRVTMTASPTRVSVSVQW